MGQPQRSMGAKPPPRARFLGTIAIAAIACGRSQGNRPARDQASAEAGPANTAARVAAPAPSPALGHADLGACRPSGKGKDYQVGPGTGQLGALELVPWENLDAGDTVRIFHRPEPYRGKFMITGKGRKDAPIRVCGVPGPHGERPVIDAAGAVSRRQLKYGHPLHESRSIVVIKGAEAGGWKDHPEHVVLDGLDLRGANPAHRFTDTAGATQTYVDFGACIWIERGWSITIAHNEIHDCTNGVFSRSTDDGEFAVTKEIVLRGNYLHSNGVVGNYSMHDSYLQSMGVLYEFNRYGPLRAGADGSALKDRSVGAVIRYNRLDGAARSLDLVEAEDYPRTAMADPRYRETFVYGNIITKDGNTGVAIHYGGDHMGANPNDGWGEPIFRKGTLYFFNNTVVLSGSGWSMYVFQLPTTEERAEIWNNVFVYAGKLEYVGFRTGQEVGPAYKTGGVIQLGVNWINEGWMPSDPPHAIPAPVRGGEHMVTGQSPPIDLVTFAPLAGSAVIDAGEAGPQRARSHPVLFELGAGLEPHARAKAGKAIDLGAIEAGAGRKP